MHDDIDLNSYSSAEGQLSLVFLKHSQRPFILENRFGLERFP